MIKLKDGTEVSEEVFYSWSARKQFMNIQGNSPEGIERQRQSMIGKSPSAEHREKISAFQKGLPKPKTPEAIEKHRAKIIGKKLAPRSEETKERMRAAWAARREAGAKKDMKPQEQVKCPHCPKVGSANPMRRWHFDNCKSKP